MKKLMYKLMALMLFSSVLFTSCSVEYRQRHHKAAEDRHAHDHDHNNNNHDNNHNYRGY